RIGTAEVESALVLHPKVAEAAVVGFPHEVKGQGIHAFVTLVAGEAETEELHRELVAHVRSQIGPLATPDILQWAPALPKTRSGKIMRRILRKIAEGAPDQLGDTSTLADPGVVAGLLAGRRNRGARRPGPGLGGAGRATRRRSLRAGLPAGRCSGSARRCPGAWRGSPRPGPPISPPPAPPPRWRLRTRRRRCPPPRPAGARC